MHITIIMFNGEKIPKEIKSFEMRKNQVTGWYKTDGELEYIDQVATIKITE